MVPAICPQIELVCRLNFVPTPPTADSSTFHHALGKLAQSLGSILDSQQKEKPIPQHPLKKIYHSKIAKHTDTEYISQTALNPPIINQKPHSNLTKSERKALKQLKRNQIL